MASVEHICERCNYVTFNNMSHTPSFCPECHSRMIHCVDEVLEEDYDDFEEEEEEED